MINRFIAIRGGIDHTGARAIARRREV